MPGLTRTLYFNYADLGKEGELVFTFNDDAIANHRMYNDYFPVVWRVVHLEASGIYRFSEKFEENFLLTTCAVQKDLVTVGSAITQIKFKQSTDLQYADDNHKNYRWSVPEEIKVDKDILGAHNMTDKVQSIAFCTKSTTVTSHVVPEPLLYFPAVPTLETLKVGFKGRLRIYYFPFLQHRMFHPGHIVMKASDADGPIFLPDFVEQVEITSPPIWDYTLDEPDLADEWIITFNKKTGKIEIKEAK